MILDNHLSYPFSGANVMFESPIPGNSFVPKQWNTDGTIPIFEPTVISLSSHFITNGVAPGDPVFIISGTPAIAVATVVAEVTTETHLGLAWVSDAAYTNVLFKVGEAAQHVFRSLVDIVADRNVEAYTVHWYRCWTKAVLAAFNADETGDVYIIDPEEERKLNGKNRVNGILEIRPELE